MSRRSIGVISALSIVFAQAGVSPSALAQEAIDLEQRCSYYRSLEDRGQLQTELEDLIRRNPGDECIPLIVDLLGPGPLAEVEENTY